MGRSKYNYLPRAYVTYPLVCPADLGAGGDPETPLTHLPVDMTATHIGEAPDPESRRGANRLASPVLGCMYSVGTMTITTGSQDLDVQDATETCLTNTVTTALTAGQENTGLARMGYSGESGFNWLATKIGGTTGQSVKMICTAGAADNFVFPAVSMVLSPGRLVNASGTVLAPDGEVTNTRGPVAGAICTIHFQETDLADETGDTILRSITMPFGFRLQKVIFAATTSNDLNRVWLENSTQSTVLTLASNEIDTSTAISEAHEPSDAVFSASGTARNFARGDVIELHGTTDEGTSTGGMTGVSCTIVGTVLDHITADNTRTIPYDGTTWPSSHDDISSVHSGPVIGGLATLYLAGDNLADEQAETSISKTTIPFDCTVLHAQIQYSTSGAVNTARIVNDTDTNDIASIAAVVAGGDVVTAGGGTAIVDSGLTNTSLTVGEVISLDVTTTGGAAITAIGATLLVHVTGFPHTDPLND